MSIYFPFKTRSLPLLSTEVNYLPAMTSDIALAVISHELAHLVLNHDVFVHPKVYDMRERKYNTARTQKDLHFDYDLTETDRTHKTMLGLGILRSRKEFDDFYLALLSLPISLESFRIVNCKIMCNTLIPIDHYINSR